MRIACLVLFLLVVACGSSAEPEPTVVPPPSVVPRWELHEWGLIGLTIDDEEGELAAVGVGPAPAAPPVDPAADQAAGVWVPIDGRSGVGEALAPVVYVQLLDDTPEVTFDLRLGLTHDAIVEAWPPAAVDDRGLLWSGVHATRATGPCGAVYPTLGDAFCQTTGAVCEAAVGASYESSDGACLAVGDAHADFLLYRARIARSALPYEVTRDGETVRPHERPFRARLQDTRVTARSVGHFWSASSRTHTKMRYTMNLTA